MNKTLMDREEPYTEEEIELRRRAEDLWFEQFNELKECSACGEEAYTMRVKEYNICVVCSRTIIETTKTNTMTKTAKIEACDFLKTFDSRNGLMYSYKLTMSNGEVGSINTKTENPPFLQPGQELMYASTSDKYGNKFTRIQPDKDKPSLGAVKAGQNWVDEPDRQKQIARQSSLKAAIDYFNCFGKGGQPSPQEIMSLADEFTAWVIK